MSDIVERLRAPHKLYNRGPDYEPLTVEPGQLALEAATTIATLRKALERILFSLTTVKGTEMDPVLGPEYRLHGIHINEARAALGNSTEKENP